MGALRAPPLRSLAGDPKAPLQAGHKLTLHCVFGEIRRTVLGVIQVPKNPRLFSLAAGDHNTGTVIGRGVRRRREAASLRVALALVLDNPLAARVQLRGEAREAAAVRGGEGRRVHVLR